MKNKQPEIIPKVPMFYRRYSGKGGWAKIVLQEGHLIFTYHSGKCKKEYYGSTGLFTLKTLRVDRAIVEQDPTLKRHKCFRRWLLRVLRELETVDSETGEKSLEIPLTHLSPEGIKDPIDVQIIVGQQLSGGKIWTEYGIDWEATQIPRLFLTSASSHNLNSLSPTDYFFPRGYHWKDRDITYLASDEDKIKYVETITRECLQRPNFPVRKMLKKRGIGK